MLPAEEKHYEWRVQFDKKDPNTHLVHPPCNEMVYGIDVIDEDGNEITLLDITFITPTDADEFLATEGLMQEAIDNDWVLCEVTVKPLKKAGDSNG